MPKSPNQNSATPQLQMTDDALVTFTSLPAPNPTGTGLDISFSDRGYMPVTQLTLGGDQRLHLPGGLDGMFIHYFGTEGPDFGARGVQHTDFQFNPTSIDYSSLHFELVGYKGKAVFSPPNGSDPTVSARQQVVLAQGDLLTDPGHGGHLQFDPTSGAIDGHVYTSLLVDGKQVGGLDFQIHHDKADIGDHSAAGYLTLTHGTLTATFMPLTA